jgi:microcystin-dependent protein
MSTYSDNLKIELITTGTQAGTWGDTTNTNLGTLVEQAISGYVLQACTGGTDVITIPDGATGVARNMYLQLTGTGGGTLVVPTNKKLYFIYNATSTAITVKVTGLTGVSVPAGAKTVLVSNGTDIIDATNYMSTLSLGAALPVTSGGTGVTTSTGSGANVLGTSPTIASPTLTGTPLAPTASAGTSTQQIATTAFVSAALAAAYPVGSIYMSTVSTTPATLLGFGTWTRYGQGRMPISADDSTYTLGATGGSATTTLSTSNLPSHSHSFSATTGSPGNDLNHRHYVGSRDSTADNGGNYAQEFVSDAGSGYGPNTYTNYVDLNHTHNVSGTTGSAGTGSAATTISPYIVVYMWTRTA